MDVNILEQDADRFAAAMLRVRCESLSDGVRVPVCGYAELMQMKTLAGRTRDLLDLQQMEQAMFELQRDHAVDPWDDCTFEGSDLANIRGLARLSFAEKLAWVEDAYQVSLAFLDCRRRMGLKSVLSDGRIMG